MPNDWRCDGKAQETRPLQKRAPYVLVKASRLTITECRSSAALCLRLGAQADDDVEGRILKQMADGWRRLANHKERNARKRDQD
jgi:hypothetical protein